MLDSPIDARYIRVTVTRTNAVTSDGTTQYCQLTEFGVYNSADAVPDGSLNITASGNLVSAAVKNRYLNDTGAPVKAKLLLAYYDKEGKLLSVTQSDVVNVPDCEARQISVEGFVTGEEYMAKAFLWDADTYTPLLAGAYKLL